MAKNLESGEHKERNQIVHIRGDSDSELQALFDSVLKPDAHRPLQLPFRLRNLPDSFFKPPPTGSKSPSVASSSHSRENSADLTFNGAPPAPSIHHSRAHSSPASLQQTMQVGQQRVVHHIKQQSCDLSIEHLPLPEGWEQAKTPQGQIYFLNHLTQTTTWEDPRKKMLQQQAQATVSSAAPTMIAPPLLSSTITPAAGSNAAAVLAASQQLNQALGPLPDGWEQAVTPEGELYYIDHHTRKTSWFDPRLPVHMQKPPMVHASGGQTLSTIQQQQQHLHQQLQSLNSGGTVSPAVANHSSQQQVRLQRLQLEQDRLRQRQQEIIAMMERETRMRQQESNIVSQPSADFNLRRTAPQNTVPNVASDQSSESVDPFLSATAIASTTPATHHCGAPGNVTANIDSPSGPAVLATDFHARQESADSGLGMGSNYSLPHTPEDFLAMDDTMDTSLDCKLLGPASVATVDMNDINPSLEVGNLPTNMDTTDELVPTLDIGEDLSTDILNEVLLNSNKVDNVLTWL